MWLRLTHAEEMKDLVGSGEEEGKTQSAPAPDGVSLRAVDGAGGPVSLSV